MTSGPVVFDPDITSADITGLHVGQYQLGDDIVFGTRSPWIVKNKHLVQSFDVSDSSGYYGDAQYPNEDGTKFGVDFISGMVLTFDIALWNRGNQGYDDLARLKKAWKNKKYRQTPNALTTIRMNRGGRTRRCYGRPRKFKETYGTIERGWAPITCDFQCADVVFYDDQETQHTVGLSNPPTAGLVLPATAPLSITQYAEAYTNILVDGDYDTWPVFVIRGPVVNPTIAYDNKWKMQLAINLNFSESLAIDTRPWHRTTLLNGLINKSGFFTAQSPVMRQMQLEPGFHDIVYTGSDASLTSTLSIGWRSAWSTP